MAGGRRIGCLRKGRWNTVSVAAKPKPPRRRPCQDHSDQDSEWAWLHDREYDEIADEELKTVVVRKVLPERRGYRNTERQSSDDSESAICRVCVVETEFDPRC